MERRKESAGETNCQRHISETTWKIQKGHKPRKEVQIGRHENTNRVRGKRASRSNIEKKENEQHKTERDEHCGKCGNKIVCMYVQGLSYETEGKERRHRDLMSKKRDL